MVKKWTSKKGVKAKAGRSRHQTAPSCSVTKPAEASLLCYKYSIDRPSSARVINEGGILLMFEQHFTQFVGECCGEIKRSPMYVKAEKELRADIEAISAKLDDDEKQRVNGCGGTLDRISALEAAIEDNYFKAGFMAGVRLGAQE
jgi:hypothetical protein